MEAMSAALIVTMKFADRVQKTVRHTLGEQELWGVVESVKNALLKSGRVVVSAKSQNAD
jgi:hypothetical protein